MSRYYSQTGKPMTMEAWARSFGDNTVTFTEISDEITVSTVWLGLDHQYGDGPPLIFETMIFGGAHNEWQWRYSTREEAEAGHEAACALARGQG